MADVLYGVTLQGFVMKPFTEILAEINADLQNIFGSTIDLSPSEPFGQLAAALAEREVLLWQLAQAVYSARDPNAAEGAGLVELASITGTIPVTPTFSTVSEILCGTNGTTVLSGSVITVQVTGVQFQTSADVTLATVPSWAGTTSYPTIGEQVTNVGQVYSLTVAGTSAGSGGPTGTTPGADITDGGAHWTWAGTGTAAATVICNSVEYGPQQALADTLTIISTPVAGWVTALNLLAATAGVGFETDTQFRLRRLAELSANGNATIGAIAGQLDKLVDSTGAALLSQPASVFENDTDYTDSFGLPPHSVQALVLPPTADPNFPFAGGLTPPLPDPTSLAVAQSILNSKAAGIPTYSSAGNYITVDDVMGNPHNIAFDYPTPQYVWVNVTVFVDSATYGGDSTVEQAIADYAVGAIPPFTGYRVGSEIFTGALYGPVLGVPGVIDVKSLQIAVTDTNSRPGSGFSSSSHVLLRNQIPIFSQANCVAVTDASTDP